MALISLNNKQYNQTYFDCYEPLALPVLKGHLLYRFGKRVDVSNIDMQHEEYDSPRKIILFLSKLKPDIIGISVPWGTLCLLDSIIKDFLKNKKLKWNPVIVLGKQLPSNFPETIINRYKEYPILITVGPGELTLEDLVNFKRSIIKLCDVRNIVYKQNDKIIYNKTANNFTVVAPAFHENVSGYNIIGLQSSRGCSWSKCSFCLRIENNKGLVQPWSPVGISIVIEEIIKLSAMGVKGINIVDENFIGGFSGLSHIKEFIKAIKDNKEKNKINKNFLFSISVRVNEILMLDKTGLLRELKEGGLCFVFVGIESCSNSQLKRYNKGINTKAIKKAVRMLYKYNILFEAGFILLDPFVSIKELKENVNLMNWRFGNSMLIDFIANPLNKGRVFHKSPLYYQLSNDHKFLLKELDINKGQYDYNFLNSEVQEIVDIIETWYPDDFHNSFVKPLRHLIMHSIHNLKHIDVYNTLQKYIADFRRIEVNFLKKIINLHEKKLPNSQINQIVQWLNNKRNNYVFSIKTNTSCLPKVYKQAIENIINKIKLN